jgi:hypothetical protein
MLNGGNRPVVVFRAKNLNGRKAAGNSHSISANKLAFSAEKQSLERLTFRANGQAVSRVVSSVPQIIFPAHFRQPTFKSIAPLVWPG